MSLALNLHYAAQGIHIVASPSSSARTKHSMIRNCLAVIFSCTWLAIHPNIPSPNTSRCATFLRRVRLTFVAMVVPEAVMMWAVKQWIAAYKLGKKYKCMVHVRSLLVLSHKILKFDIFVSAPYGWTQRHGFFAIMGGFSVYEDDKEPHTITPSELDELLKNGEIKITEEEIQSKGKGKDNALLKAAILIQTTWFILQCIARTVESLPITELELVTLGFAALNFVTYVVWWNKPLNVECALRIYRKGKGGDEVGIGGTGNTQDESAAKSTTGIATPIRTVPHTPNRIPKMLGEIGRAHV